MDIGGTLTKLLYFEPGHFDEVDNAKEPGKPLEFHFDFCIGQ